MDINLITVHQRTFWKLSFIRIISLTSISVFCLASRLPVASAAMPTASKSPMPAAAKPTTHAAAATHAASEPAPETAVHTSAEAGLAAEGMLVCHAVVESAECAGVAAPLHVRRSEATIGSMVEVASEIVITSEIVAISEMCAAVEKDMAP
jgi:hypothetical protein